MGTLRDSVQFATAAGLDQASAAELSARQLGIWTSATATAAEQNDFLTKSHDLMVRAANAAVIGVTDLAAGMNVAGGQAQALNLDYRDFTVTMAELAPAFNSTQEAGTAYKNFLARIQPTTTAATAAMQDLGLWTKDTGSAFFDATGNYVGNRQAAELLFQATKDLTTEEKAHYLQTIFGNDAMGAAVKLSTDAAAGYDAMSAKLDKASGVTEAAAIKQEGFKTAVTNAKGSLEALQLTIGSKVLPILTGFVNDYITPAINAVINLTDALSGNNDAFNQLWPPLQQIAIFLQPIIDGFGAGGLAGALAATVTQIDTLIPGFANVVTWLSGALSTAIAFVTDHWDAFKGALIALGAVLAGAAIAGAIISIGATIAALANPITLVIGAVALLGAAWSTDFMGIQTTLTAFWVGTAQPILAQLVTWLSANVPSAVATVSAFFTSTLLPALQTIGAFIQNPIMPILAFLGNVALKEVGAEVSLLGGLWTGVLWPALQTIVGFLSGTVFPILSALANVYIAMSKKEVEALSGLWQKTLLPALASVGSFITSTVVPALESAGSTINTAVGPAVQAFTGWLGSATGGINGIVGAVQGAIRWLNNLADSISHLSLPSWMTPGSPTPWEIGLRGVTAAMAQLTQGPISSLTMQLQGAAGISSPLVPMAATAGQFASSGGSRSLVINVDARGSTLSEAQITRAVQIGISSYDRSVGRDVDARVRTGG
jgi:TP901 family phage tail tape measure protein